MPQIKVLIVDDSAVVCARLKKAIEADPNIKVVGQAPDPFIARDQIVQLQPDVLTLDMQMPRMDGLTFLKKLMAHHPMPVVVISAFTSEGASLTLDALSIGAVDVLEKPDFSNLQFDRFAAELCDKIKAASHSRIRPTAKRPPQQPARSTIVVSSRKIIALGASTGGTEALQNILQRLPQNMPPTLIVQHMPKGFTGAFARRLNQSSAMKVVEAQAGMALETGTAYIAPGDQHLVLGGSPGKFQITLRSGPAVCRHKPSVDVLFKSIARLAGRQAIAALLTGMGRDGAEGLLQLRQAGAQTLAQDQASSVVFGMPKEAIELGAASAVISLDKMADTLLACL